ncbi:hypothetical protein NLM33_48275 (plasmid) [Bradyrhizobium sp. CCGUVB1N3]|uniref:hypothetical protein n=1 Tax=Bradyrhizobium sp. CCGUVB1N3 TaxID=2949629 RepID=UPI0020B1A9E5|nr:hypothetical protein [Bradyrhizobium sp. CCGUVB1N3]MCP3477881.1 hypothetical protein [Bradyrhizobium sp. CCGUVB1N3]
MQKIAIDHVLDVHAVDLACDLVRLALQSFVFWHDLERLKLLTQPRCASLGDGQSRPEIGRLTKEPAKVAAPGSLAQFLRNLLLCAQFLKMAGGILRLAGTLRHAD